MSAKSALPRTRSLLAAGAAALIAIGGLTACGEEEPTREKNSSSQQDGAKKDAPKEDNNKQMAPGDTASYKNGLKITVSKATAYTPGEFSAGHKSGNKAYTVTISLENTGEKDINAVLVDVSARAGDEGKKADKIFDSENEAENTFDGELLPGKKATATYAFSAPADAKHLDVEVGYFDFSTKAAHWKLPL
ncbi:DUF4352 domain-containing protein [Streptomyces sp. OF3]|uniref:DUF4352 domain-containing protein n=1 Tax=Streptomyces alkaliterrae TaxID=2213162 RepID=A0A7W3WQ76_9ACTN|nr:DUF4352 domain-containing protein [Streptomyces alkaliterrae]MBB1256310.1 DUF4352 domain-containing protein [Streptomyces alkaliterrae]